MKLFLEAIEVIKDQKGMGGKSPSMLRVEITDDEDGRKKLAKLQADIANKTIFDGNHVVRVHECREGAPCTVRNLAESGIISSSSDATPDAISLRLDALEASVIIIHGKQNEIAEATHVEPSVLPTKEKIDFSRVNADIIT
jgi:hypothetical protein